MNNFEKYKEKLQELSNKGINIAIDEGTGTPCNCKDISCLRCGIYSNVESCKKAMIKWLLSEYKEPPVDWSKVPVDTLVLVRDSEKGDWIPRYFAEYVRTTDGWRIGVWEGGCTSKTVKDGSPVKDPRSYMSYWKMGKLAEEE